MSEKKNKKGPSVKSVGYTILLIANIFFLVYICGSVFLLKQSDHPGSIGLAFIFLWVIIYVGVPLALINVIAIPQYLLKHGLKEPVKATASIIILVSLVVIATGYLLNGFVGLLS